MVRTECDECYRRIMHKGYGKPLCPDCFLELMKTLDDDFDTRCERKILEQYESLYIRRWRARHEKNWRQL